MRRSFLLFPALALVWGCGGGGSSPFSNNGSGGPVLALVGSVTSPVANEIAGLGPVVGASDASANLLVVDGDTFSGTLAEEKILIDGWRQGKALLVLDADEGDLERDLIRLTGIVPDKELAAVYLRKRKDGGIDQIHLDKSAKESHATAMGMRKEFLRRVDVAFREELPVPAFQSTARAGSGGFKIGPFPISKVYAQDITSLWSYEPETNLYIDGQAPARTATLNMADTITVIGSGSYGGQYPATAYITFAGNANSSVGSFPDYETGSDFFNTYYIRGYANLRHSRKIGVVYDQGQPILGSALPANAAGEKEVTSGFNVSIDVGEEGPSGGFGFSSETSTVIEGWSVDQRLVGGPGSTIEWNYQEQLSADGRNQSAIYNDLFTNGESTDDDYGVYSPSLLATSVIQSAPMIFWAARESDGTQQATVTSETVGWNSFWFRNDPDIGTSAATWYLGGKPTADTYPGLAVSTEGSVVISLTELWNQMGYLTSVTVPATTQPGEMTVSVELDHPAPAAGMPVSLSSTAPGIIPSQQLVVPAGAKTFNFQLPVERGFQGNVTLGFLVNGLSKSANVEVRR
ncbi:hypothetical protein EON79_05805 [bacterium]|nr:MAG: hypothetical protein EON79_05805 [bacterium]